jgi:hypothetical protein
MHHSLGRTFVLRVYTSKRCALSQHASQVVAGVKRELPEVRVVVIDIDATSEALPDAIFSVPTYTLNDQVVSLGNPDSNFVEMLRRLIAK